MSYVRCVLTKRRLEGFELQVTSVLDLDAHDGDEEQTLKDSKIEKNETSKEEKIEENNKDKAEIESKADSCENSDKGYDSGTGGKRRSVYDSALKDDVESGISELEHSVSELISKVGHSIGNGFIEEETEEDIELNSEEAEKKVNEETAKDSQKDDVLNCPPVSLGAEDGFSPARRTAAVLGPVVEMICDTLSSDLAPSLSRLVLAFELDTCQVNYNKIL